MTNTNTDKRIKASSCDKWKPEEDEIILSSKGKTVKEILLSLPGRSYNSVYLRLQKHGIPTTRGKDIRAWSDEDIVYLKENYGKVKWPELCERLKRSERAICEYARKRGLKILKDENGDTVNTAGRPSLRRLLDGSLQSYYWMGYLMADGYMHHGLSQIVLVSAEEDAKHMKSYAKYLGAKCHCYVGRCSFTGTPVKHYRVSVADKIQAVKIEKMLDWHPRKTYNPPSSSVLEVTLAKDDLFMAFLIGFLDGDGNLTSGSGARVENHSSWLVFHQFIVDRLNRMNFETSPPKINRAGYSDFYMKQPIVQFLKNFIDKNSLSVLTRKWNKVRMPEDLN